MTSILRVAFTSYAVTDLKRARAFYEGVLGLTPGDHFEGAMQEYDIGGTTFAVDASNMPFNVPGTGGSLAFEVSDIRALVARMLERRVEFVALPSGEIMETPVCFIACAKDPDGNVVTLHQLK